MTTFAGRIHTNRKQEEKKKQKRSYIAVRVISKAIIVENVITVSIMLFHHYSFLSFSRCFIHIRSFVCSVPFLGFVSLFFSVFFSLFFIPKFHKIVSLSLAPLVARFKLEMLDVSACNFCILFRFERIVTLYSVFSIILYIYRIGWYVFARTTESRLLRLQRNNRMGLIFVGKCNKYEKRKKE